MFRNEDALIRMDPDDVMAYRWLAMARFYENNGLLNTK
jgi:isopentenyldiphosphate isomerase